jgi:hypothetical protein
MKWYSEKLYGFILVMLKIWKYTALPTYSLEKTNNQCSSPVVVKKTGFHFLILIFTLGNIILYITYYGVDSSLKASSYFFQFCTICTYNTCLISVLHMKRKKMATLLINIFSIESHALKLFHNSNCSDVSKYFTKYAAAKFCIIVMILYGDFYYFINNTKDLVLRVCLYSQWIFYCISELSLIFFPLILKKFYTELNDYLKNDDFSLREAFHFISLLRKLARKINKLLETLYLFKLVTDCCLLTNDIFLGVSAVMTEKRNFASYGILIVVICVWFVTIFLHDLIVTDLLEKVLEQVS